MLCLVFEIDSAKTSLRVQNNLKVFTNRTISYVGVKERVMNKVSYEAFSLRVGYGY